MVIALASQPTGDPAERLSELLRSGRANRRARDLGFGVPPSHRAHETGLSGAHMAALLGISERNYAELERGGVRQPPVPRLRKVADILRFSTADRARLYIYALRLDIPMPNPASHGRFRTGTRTAEESAALLRAQLTAGRAAVRPMDVGLNVPPARGRRHDGGLTHWQMAALLGISERHYATLERGRVAQPPVTRLRAAADILRFGPAERTRLYTYALQLDIPLPQQHARHRLSRAA